MSTEIRFDPDPAAGTLNAPNVPNYPIANQVAVTDVATLVAASRSGRGSVTIKNIGANNVFVGNEDVTAAEGFELEPNEGHTVSNEGRVYAICSGGQNSSVSVIEDSA